MGAFPSLGMDNVETQPLEDAPALPLPSTPPVIPVHPLPCPPAAASKEEVEEHEKQVVDQPPTEVAHPSESDESGSLSALEKIRVDLQQAVKECAEVLETTSCENGSAGRLAMRGVQSILLHFLDEYHPEIPLGDTMTQEILEEQKAAEAAKEDPLAKNWRLKKFLAEECNTKENEACIKGNDREGDTPKSVREITFIGPPDQRKIRGRGEAKAKAKAKAKSGAKSKRKSKASKESEVKTRRPKSKASKKEESEVKTRRRKSKASKTEESEVKSRRRKSKASNKEEASGSNDVKAKKRPAAKKPAAAESDAAAEKKRKHSAMSSAYHVAKSQAAAAGKSLEEQKAAGKLAPCPHYINLNPSLLIDST